MQEFAKQLKALLGDPKWTVDRVTNALGVCRASLFHYKNEEDLANPDVFRRAHEKLGFEFPYMDFDSLHKPEPRAIDPNAQGVFSFIHGLRKEDVEVISKKNVGRETLELTVQIRFGGRSRR